MRTYEEVTTAMNEIMGEITKPYINKQHQAVLIERLNVLKWILHCTSTDAEIIKDKLLEKNK